ncbi:Vacuolar protein sorting 55 [Trypanosoma brucei equiperdum]|uniref:Vacuolar protein sorting 55 n=1 Tax=Trypanosoma brucei equiperdum TaxID=630700 RepID=A0A3L6LDR8_9TRYP|nr:Vacuolar protein sorting 55 [Trypanosoma brucei equiperdum]
MAALLPLVLSASLVVVAVVLSILACTVVAGSNVLPLFSLLLSFITPLPFLFFWRSESTFDDDGEINGFVVFLSGALAVSAPSLSIVLYHTGYSSLGAFLLSLGSQVTLLGAAAFLQSGERQDEEGNYDL